MRLQHGHNSGSITVATDFPRGTFRGNAMAMPRQRFQMHLKGLMVVKSIWHGFCMRMLSYMSGACLYLPPLGIAGASVGEVG